MTIQFGDLQAAASAVARLFPTVLLAELSVVRIGRF